MASQTSSEQEQQAFIAALQGEDELGVVVRAHIYVESSLLHLLSRLVTEESHLKKMDLDFAQRVHLAMALGLKPEHGPPLLALGTLRNAFAHRPETKLTKDRIDSLYKTLSAEDKALVQKAYEGTKSRMRATIPGFRALAPKDQFVLIAVSLRAMLLAAIIHAGHANAEA